VRLATHEPTGIYMVRRTQKGVSKSEIIRCLKCDVAREIYRELIPRAAGSRHASTALQWTTPALTKLMPPRVNESPRSVSVDPLATVAYDLNEQRSQWPSLLDCLGPRNQRSSPRRQVA
jgi:hypothetical protein